VRQGSRGRPSPAAAGDGFGAAQRPRAAAPAARHSWMQTSGRAGQASHKAGRRSGRTDGETRMIIIPDDHEPPFNAGHRSEQTSGTPQASQHLDDLEQHPPNRHQLSATAQVNHATEYSSGTRSSNRAPQDAPARPSVGKLSPVVAHGFTRTPFGYGGSRSSAASSPISAGRTSVSKARIVRRCRAVASAVARTRTISLASS